MTHVNSINANFINAFNKELETEANMEKIQYLFDDGCAAEKDATKDAAKNNKAIDDIDKLAASGKKDKDAIQNAVDKAAKMQKNLENKDKEVMFMGYPVTAAKAKKNSNVVNISVKVDGKECKGSITYAKDGSCVMTLDSGKEKIEKIVDKNGVIREKTTYNKETKQTTVKEYDKTGKVNTKTVTDKNNKDYNAVTYYDDNGQASKKITKDGVNTTTALYEYDKKGNMVGRYCEIVNDTTKEKTIKATVIDGNNKTTTETKPDGTVSTYKYERKDADSDWTILNKEVQKKDAENKSTYEYCDKVKNEDGTFTRNRKVTTSNGKVYYEVQTIGTNGKVTNLKRYSDEAHTVLLTDTATEYDNNGNKTKVTKNKVDKEGKVTSGNETTYDAKTGKPSGQINTMFDGEGNTIRTEEQSFNEDGTSVNIVKYKVDGKEIEEKHTIRADGSVETIENVTNGFTTYLNAGGSISKIDINDTNTDNVEKQVPNKSAPNSTIPLFSKEDGMLIGTAKYDKDGLLTGIDWVNGFGPKDVPEEDK